MAAVWRAGLGAYFSRRATGELRRALKTLDASFEVKEAVVDFGVRPPYKGDASTRRDAFLCTEALEQRSGTQKPTLAFAVDLEAWSIDTQAFLTLDLELRGRFAKFGLPRIGAVFEDANYLHLHYSWPWSCRRTILSRASGRGL